MVKKLFKDLSREGVTIFMSTHTLKIAEDVCDRIGIIHNGRLITTGSPGELKKKTQLLEADLEDVFIKLTTEN